ncbi:MAG: ATP-binding cassette domain-containing protein [Alphaproteobacteria bacterium]|jgi:simple sugar transport system ATP-binding protein|nr:ATP-binding cassette domain-containing protein [Alphaproteobacteria bacterium]
MTARPPVLCLAGIGKSFGDLVANDAIDLSLGRGEILALLGENGAGKTTLMNILFGHYVADEGSIEVAGPDGRLAPLPPGSPQAALAAGIGMVHQHFTLADNLSVLDNIVLGTERWWQPFRRMGRARQLLAGLIERAGLAVDLDVPAGSLSVGERQRVEILKALYREARILILDEPTAVLTPQETDGLFAVLRRLAADGLAIVFISHKLAEVMAISERVMVLRAGRVVEDVATAATDRAALAEAMVGRPIPAMSREPLKPGDPALVLDGVDVAGTDHRGTMHGVDLTVKAREMVGIAGVAGNGQGALAALLSGLAPPAAGRVTLFGGPFRPDAVTLIDAGVGRIPEDRHRDGVVGDMTLWENAVLEDYRRHPFRRAGLLDRAAARAHTARLMAEHDVRGGGLGTPARLLSGGNMQKLILGRVLDREPGLILAHQPTRGLDIGAATAVQARLLEARGRGAAIVLISEDLDELLQLTDRIAVFYRGRLTPLLPTEGLSARALGLMMAGHAADEALAETAERRTDAA